MGARSGRKGPSRVCGWLLFQPCQKCGTRFGRHINSQKGHRPKCSMHIKVSKIIFEDQISCVCDT